MLNPPFLISGLLCLCQIAATASEATFSPDGKTLWLLSRESDALISFKSGDPAPKRTALPKALTGESTPSEILSDAGGLLIAGPTKLWQWNPAEPKSEPKSVADLPPQFGLTGLSRAEGTDLAGTIFISGYHSFDSEHPAPKDFNESNTLYGLKAGEKTFKSVFVRRLEHVTGCPAFSGERMVFAGDSDVWEGGIEIEEDSEDRLGSLWGFRTTPLAMANTDAGNSGSMGTRSVVIAGGTIWAELRGRHMGALVSLPLLKKPADQEPPDLADSWKIQREQLALAKAIRISPGEDEPPTDVCESIDSLCAWNGPDGAWKIAFRSDFKTVWLLEKGAKEPMKLFIETPPEDRD
jgi:hypothetical protein